MRHDFVQTWCLAEYSLYQRNRLPQTERQPPKALPATKADEKNAANIGVE